VIRPIILLVSGIALTALGMLTFARGSGTYVPTYYVDVQPILEKNCVTCHIVGGIAPFALDNPTDAVTWAERIAMVTKSELMPPYPPGRDSERFIGERRLGSASKGVLEDWAKAGAPLGKPPRP
jgi:hypothetical protein